MANWLLAAVTVVLARFCLLPPSDHEHTLSQDQFQVLQQVVSRCDLDWQTLSQLALVSRDSHDLVFDPLKAKAQAMIDPLLDPRAEISDWLQAMIEVLGRPAPGRHTSQIPTLVKEQLRRDLPPDYVVYMGGRLSHALIDLALSSDRLMASHFETSRSFLEHAARAAGLQWDAQAGPLRALPEARRRSPGQKEP